MDTYEVYLRVLDGPINVSDMIREHNKCERRLVELRKSYSDMNKEFQDYKEKIKGI